MFSQIPLTASFSLSVDYPPSSNFPPLLHLNETPYSGTWDLASSEATEDPNEELVISHRIWAHWLCPIINKGWEKVWQINSLFFLPSIHHSEAWFLFEICLVKSQMPSTHVSWEICRLSLWSCRFTLTYLSLLLFSFSSFFTALGLYHPDKLSTP